MHAKPNIICEQICKNRTLYILYSTCLIGATVMKYVGLCNKHATMSCSIFASPDKVSGCTDAPAKTINVPFAISVGREIYRTCAISRASIWTHVTREQ